MKKAALLLFMMILQTTSLFAVSITHGPWISDMDSTSITIMWITDKPGLSWVELAADDGLHFYSQSHAKKYDTLNGRRVVTDTIHRVRIDGLTPDTRYRYRIFTKELLKWTWSDYTTYGDVAASVVYHKDPFTFRTDPVGCQEQTFVVFNDIHQRADYLKQLCTGIDFNQVDFVVLNGDMSNMIDSPDNILKAYLDTCVSIFASSVPIYLNRGNHETRGKHADHLYRYFSTPTAKYYQLKTIGGVDFLFLDSGEDKPDTDIEYGDIADFDQYRIEEAKWLHKLRTEGRVGHRPLIVFCHIPPLASTWHGPMHLRETLVPELNRLPVTAMLSGHTHNYGFDKPNDIIQFPNVINSNMAYMLCKVSSHKLEIESAETNGKNKKHYTLDLR